MKRWSKIRPDVQSVAPHHTRHHGAAGIRTRHFIALAAFEEGDVHATHAQLKLVAEHHALRTREFAFEAAAAVARLKLSASGALSALARRFVSAATLSGCQLAPWAVRGIYTWRP